MSRYNNYEVQYSEEDLFQCNGIYARMHTGIFPVPSEGNYLVKNDGVYEITHVHFALDFNYDIQIESRLTQCENNDTIVVTNKDRLYRCYKSDTEYGFKKVSLLSLLNSVEDLVKKMNFLKKMIEINKDELSADILHVRSVIDNEKEKDQNSGDLINEIVQLVD